MNAARPIKNRLCQAACSGLLAVPLLAAGQSYDNPSLGQRPVSSHPQDYKPLGIRAGSFMLHPGVELATQWHDNILYTSSNELSDTIFHVRPYITAQSTWSRHSFSVRAAADVARYQDYGFRDYEDYFLQAAGIVDVTSRSYFSYGFDWMQLHEERNIRSAEQGIEPTVFTILGGHVGYDQTFNRFSLGLLYDLRQIEYDDNYDLAGNLIDNADRDRNEQAFTLRMGYQFKAERQAFVMLGWDATDFDQQFDRNGFERSWTGWNASAGLNFTLTGVLSGDVYVTYREADYDDPRLPNTDGVGLGAGLNWLPTQLTRVYFNVATSIEDTTSPDASGYFRTLYSVRADHELRRNLQIMGQLSYYDFDYQLLPSAPLDARSEDSFFGADVGLTYFFNRWLWLSASYSYGSFDTNVVNDDFKANSAWLVLGLER